VRSSVTCSGWFPTKLAPARQPAWRPAVLARTWALRNRHRFATAWLTTSCADTKWPVYADPARPALAVRGVPFRPQGQGTQLWNEPIHAVYTPPNAALRWVRGGSGSGEARPLSAGPSGMASAFCPTLRRPSASDPAARTPSQGAAPMARPPRFRWQRRLTGAQIWPGFSRPGAAPALAPPCGLKVLEAGAERRVVALAVGAAPGSGFCGSIAIRSQPSPKLSSTRFELVPDGAGCLRFVEAALAMWLGCPKAEASIWRHRGWSLRASSSNTTPGTDLRADRSFGGDL